MSVKMSAGQINQVEALAKLKRDVRSLLMASKMGLYPEELKREYMAMLGHPIPLKPLGFINVLDMAKEMPDVVTVQFGADGRLYLKVVSDESTRHIEELVAKQRSSRADMVKDAGFHHLFRHSRSRSCSSSSSVILPRRGGAPPALSAQLRSQLHTLLSHGPLKLSDLETHFLRCFGHPLRVHNHGFYSTAEMLQAAADLVQVQQGRLGSVLSLRPQAQPSQHRSPVTPATPVTVRAASETVDTRAQAPVESSGGVTVKQGPQSLSSADSTFNQEASTAVGDKPEVKQEVDVNMKHQKSNRSVHKLEEELREMILEHHRLTVAISPELKNKLLKVVSQSGKLSVYDLPAEYKRLFGEDLPLQQSGFANLGELLSYMADTFHLKPAVGQDNRRQWIVTVVHDSDVGHPDSQQTEQQDPCDSSSCRESPWNDELREADEEDDDEDENMENDLETTLHHKTHNVVSVTYPVMHVYSSCPDVPLDAMQSQRLKPPTRYAARQMLEVQLEDVESPGRFHIRFSRTMEAQAMEVLKTEMRQCYKSPVVSRRYRLPQRFVRQGQVCCVCPGGRWFQRAVIHRVLSSTQVEVYCVDQGSMSVVQSADLRFLKCCYSALPAQAVPASLAGIKPTSGGWSAKATASLLKLCRERPLVAALECYTGDVLQLYLCDTHTEDDIYMHAVLLSQGHATACSPAASAALCARVTPVSLYLGEGMLDLPDIKVETSTSSTKQADLLQEPTPSTAEDTEINLFCAMQNNQIEGSSIRTILPSPSTCSEAPPEVSRGEAPAPTWEMDFKCWGPPLSLQSRDDSSSDAARVQRQEKEVSDLSPASTGGRLSGQPPDLIKGLLRFQFPLFGTLPRPFPLIQSPLPRAELK